MNEFILMHKNTPVAYVALTTQRLKANEIINEKLLPIGVRNAPEGAIHNMLTMWNDVRCIPTGRPDYEKFMNYLGVDGSIDYLQFTHMCSLTDCYWFKPEHSELRWEDVNFRDNGLNSNIYRHLFYNDYSEPINNLHSPDIATNGMLKKMWEEHDGDYFLIKRPNYGPEPAVEYISSQIIANMGIDRVPYDLVNRNGVISSSCPCFIKTNNQEFVPFDNLLTDLDKNSRHAFNVMCSLGFEQEVSEMLLCDYIIGNVDRHSKNYGFVVDAETQSIIQTAPLFDHGDGQITENIDMYTSKVGDRPFIEMIKQVDPKYFNRFLDLSLSQIFDFETNNSFISQDFITACYDAVAKRLDTLGEIKLELEQGHERDR